VFKFQELAILSPEGFAGYLFAETKYSVIFASEEVICSQITKITNPSVWE